MTDIIIIGAGTAGLSAAIYALRSGKSVLLLEENTYGGQIINTPAVENYPGIKNVSGFDFATGLFEQAEGLGAELRYEKALEISEENGMKQVRTEKDVYPCGAVILCTGARNRSLGLAKEEEWIGSGISYCATCDGAFFRGQTVAVAGGGNTALEDALFLSGYCEKVFLIHRRFQFRGEEGLVQKLREKDNVEFVLNVLIEELQGDDHLSGVKVREKDTGETTILPVTGLFIAVGQVPANEAFRNLVTLDPAGYIEAGEDCRTNVPWIFTAGDCRTKPVRQLTTAAADGAVAALAACAYLS